MNLVKGETTPDRNQNFTKKGIVMKTLLTSTLAIAMALTASSLAFADGKGSSGHGSNGSHGSVQNTGKNTGKNTSLHTVSNHHQTNVNKNINKNFNKNYTTQKTNYKNYHLTHGKKIGKGYCYPGKFHKHWDFCCFNKGYGCYLYYCPCTFGWYYFCEPDCCYYPVWYVPYRCYAWGTPVSFSTAPCPPADLDIPDPVEVLGPTE
jgi:hypothetical protein